MPRLSTWQDVQKLWQALESIYVGSEDIQKQLPQDSQRFNAINGQFKASFSALCVSLMVHKQLDLPLSGNGTGKTATWGAGADARGARCD